jgi:FlaA1/EpsC-like NDP-sugar epimerase
MKVINKHRSLILFLLDLITFVVIYLFALFFFLTALTVIEKWKLYYLILLIFSFEIPFFIFKVYKPLWRYAGLREIIYLFISCIIASFIFVISISILEHSMEYLVFSLFVCFTSTLLILASRVFYKILLRWRVGNDYKRNKVVIVGGGNACAMLLKNMGEAELKKYNVVAIFDDDKLKFNKQINGVTIVGSTGLIPTFCKAHNIEDIIIAIPSATTEQMNRIVDLCMMTECIVRTMPTMSELINDNKFSSWSQIKDINIEDLLERDVINLKTPLLKSQIENKVVMVTGGGGSIGSELCRQIALNNPAQLIILDYYENNAYDIQQELIRLYHDKLNLVVEICNVRELDKVDYIFDKYRPNLVYHAAAHKHVPLMEHNPEEAVKNNIFGTYNVATTADKYKVEKFTLISSDKAVNPTNIMGATKRFCEMIIQSMNTISTTQFVAVRFGNVLGSNGSVVPLFKKQIQGGGPVTVTHPDMVRYFMTIKEAVSLVLTAAASADKGAVFILDMGSPVRILDFAKKMIRLSGYCPEREIKIEFTGLRPGEKLFEELLVTKDKTKTNYDKIFVEELPDVSIDVIKNALRKFKIALEQKDFKTVVDVIKQYVTTYSPPKAIGEASLPEEYKNHKNENANI